MCCMFQIALFQTHPQLKQCVRPAIERSVQELLLPVVERSIKIALTTCEQIVKKVRGVVGSAERGRWCRAVWCLWAIYFIFIKKKKNDQL